MIRTRAKVTAAGDENYDPAHEMTRHLINCYEALMERSSSDADFSVRVRNGRIEWHFASAEVGYDNNASQSVADWKEKYK